MQFFVANKSKVYYALPKDEPSSSTAAGLAKGIEDEEIGPDGSKKRKAKGKEGAKDKGKKVDPNAPSYTRIPLPDW